MRNDRDITFERPPQQRPVGRIVLAVFLLLLLISTGIRVYIDQLWFESLGYESVYWYGITAQTLTFIIFFAVSTIALLLLFHALISAAGMARRAYIEVQGRIMPTPSLRAQKMIARSLAGVLGLLMGLVFSARWRTFALYWNRQPAGDVADPIFGRSIEFYFFGMPVLEIVSAWLIAIAVVTAIAAIAYLVTGMTTTFRGISIAVSVVLAAIALRTFLARYNLLFREGNLFSGVSYVEDNVIVYGLMATTVALIAGALLAAVNRSGNLRMLAAAVGAPMVVHLVGSGLIAWYVSTFIVRPNELVRETPYIRNSIDFTRKAYNLDTVEELPFEPRETNAVFDPNANRATLDNLRLWDWKALQDTLRQLQVIRTYYDFPDVDIDRYVINGKLTNTMLATREIDINLLGAGLRNWVNDRLIYTHGYGVVMNGASRFTRDGLPEFLLSNMPVDSRAPEIEIKRPEIYFGELTTWPVYARTGQKEFNFPGEGDSNNYNTYEGTGGIRMGSLLRQILLAYEVGDLLTVPFSDDITADSVLLFRRGIMERTQLLAPFLTLDDDPYMVVGEDGALYWMLDAYTTSRRYPYSRSVQTGRGSINYLRNSVKAVIDAYNGSVTFYVFDTNDPIINTYRAMLPELFRPASDMPDFLRKHIRYPELLFQIQALIYSSYHVEDEQVFYNREDVWAVAQQGRSQTGNQTAEAIEPYFVLMTLPGESQLEFVSILPFTPARRNNMIGWLAARSDGEHYGKLRAYNLPKTRFIDGPLQIQARIEQDAQLSSQLTLWNQQGTSVIRGNLLVIPIDDTLLFVDPIYLQAQRSRMPALRLIVLATQDRLSYATTFDEALQRLMEGRRGTLTEITGTSGTPGASASTASDSGEPTPPADTGAAPPSASLAARASQALLDYQRLTAAGRLAEAGARLEELKTLLEQMNRQ